MITKINLSNYTERALDYRDWACKYKLCAHILLSSRKTQACVSDSGLMIIFTHFVDRAVHIPYEAFIMRNSAEIWRMT